MRKFLQNPAQGKTSKFISIKFAIETIESVEELLKHPFDDPISVLSLEFLVGTYALYGAQIKWHFPDLIDLEHLAIRDHIMHGKDHNYEFHQQEKGLEQIKKQISHLLSVKNKLVQFYQENTAQQ
eukprot:TRINITY_DN11839_c0_g1_i1.p1 TRINITY_DN11839_c0_g1~~TRINITY_DN11839_c0_g1_i1.p1  ORF type:complete len:142 (+),score=31.08 TRINITY_DN11839_c0_g1_i1:52-426(+)